MLILILIDVQYSQKAVFSFEKGSNCQNHSSSGSHHLLKNPLSQIFDSAYWEEFTHPHPRPLTPYRYLEKLATTNRLTTLTPHILIIRFSTPCNLTSSGTVSSHISQQYNVTPLNSQNLFHKLPILALNCSRCSTITTSHITQITTFPQMLHHNN